MQIRAYKLLFSNLRTHEISRLPKLASESSVFLYLPLAHLSTNTPNRPFRGKRGSGRRDDSDRSESQFSLGRDFGDEGSKEQSLEKLNRPPPPPFQSPNRPLAGQRGQTRRMNVDADDFFPTMRNDSTVTMGSRNQQHTPPSQPPIKGGEWRNYSAQSEDEDDDEEEEFESLLQEFPQQEQHSQLEKEKDLDGIGDTLFEKLKLANANANASCSRSRNTEEEPHKTTTPVSDNTGPEPDSPPPEEADEIFRKMKETGLIPNAVAMLDGLCKDGLVQEAMKLFGLMREKGSIPEVVIYTAVVEGFCKAAKFDDAKRIFRKMQKNGIVPNAYSYGVLIQGLCKGARLDDCVELCTEMFEAGHSPNAATFVGLVDVFCRNKGVEEAEKLVKRFQDRNFAIDEKSIREHLDKKGPFSPHVSEAIFGKKASRRPF